MKAAYLFQMEALRTCRRLWEILSCTGVAGAGHQVVAEAGGQDSPAGGLLGGLLSFQGRRSSPEPSSRSPTVELEKF